MSKPITVQTIIQQELVNLSSDIGLTRSVEQAHFKRLACDCKYLDLESGGRIEGDCTYREKEAHSLIKEGHKGVPLFYHGCRMSACPFMSVK